MAEKKKRKQRQTTETKTKEPLFTGRKQIQAAAAVVFTLLLVLICAADLLHKDQKFSEDENRILALRPSVTVSNVADGRFMRQYEDYRADQFPGRNLWVQVKTFADSVMGKNEENGVFNGSDGYLLEDITVPDKKNLNENLDAMKAFRKRYPDIPMQVMLVPNAANILSSKLPALAVTADQNRLIGNVENKLEDDFDWIDVTASLKAHRDEEIFYRTDHHWTTLGAYQAFKDAKKQLGIDQLDEVTMKAYGVSDHFNGTLSAVSGYRIGYKEPLYIYLPDGKNAPQFVVNYVEEQKKTASLYDSSKLEERDQYKVFFGGNHPLIEIKSTSAGNGRLLVIKDSYANCFLPFLAPYYREILVVDPRYYSGDLNKLIKENQISQVLFLYNANTFFGDKMLAGVLDDGK